MEIKKFLGSNDNVTKYVFSSETEVYEAVLYKYGSFYERTVICCSVMSGCPVGCTFCGTGRKFIRNLTHEEICSQIVHILSDMDILDINSAGKRFQIMFMSMGEPMLNWNETELAIKWLNHQFRNAELLISTIGVNDDSTFAKITSLSTEISKIGFQFSIHKSNDNDRNILIPFKNKWNLTKIRDAGIFWWKETGRKPYLNYCIDGSNNTNDDFDSLSKLFSPLVFNFTFSVVCDCQEDGTGSSFRRIEDIKAFENMFIEAGYNTRVFDPAGQDDIGGGCGQLWYVQEWMKNHQRRPNNANI